ncbi:MAG TPA: phosphate ABC transporter permease PstA [Casimicrobiaceae bacterium]|nr:phosphate ABC transporter permease PstA [Casimicrobiaceae bacterium]
MDAIARLGLRRRIANRVALALSTLATLFGLVFLFWILWMTFARGLSALHLDLFTKITIYGDQGGLANAIVGSLIINLLGIVFAAPVGVLAGTWLAEYANRSALGATVRFLNDILLSAPSIVLGLFVYTVVVLPMKSATDGAITFSGFAGAIALALIALPVVVRTTDEMLRLVPSTLREATLSLGIPQWKMTVQILIRSARSGIVTGVLLALARISGETAPLLFTAFGNDYMNFDPLNKMASLPQVVYQFANDASDTKHAIAWAGALMVTVFVLVLSLLSRAVTLRKKISAE